MTDKTRPADLCLPVDRRAALDDYGMRPTSVGRVLIGLERDIAIQQFLAWRANNDPHLNHLNDYDDDSPIGRFAREHHARRNVDRTESARQSAVTAGRRLLVTDIETA